MPVHFDVTVYSNPPTIGGGFDVRGRHRGLGLNFVFVDGHGEFVKKGEWYNIKGSTQWYIYCLNGYNWGIWAE